MPWKQRECQEQAHRPKHQRGLWEQKKRNAAMRLDVWSDLHKRSDAWCLRRRRSSRSIRQNYTHRGERRMFKPLAWRVTAGMGAG